MTQYGIQPTGYIRKPLSVILAELEAAMITEFGPGVIQTPQSPLGQLNGMMSDLVSEIDERNLDLYQSNDPDQAEGIRLDTLARLRLFERGAESDAELRASITNEGQSRVDVQDLARNIKGIEGVTYSQVFVNETGEVTSFGLDSGTVAVAVIGGDDEEISRVIRRFIVPGINTYGNHHVSSVVDGFCRNSSIIRPINVVVDLQINLRTSRDRFGCPPPSPIAIRDYLVQTWMVERINGLDPSFFNIRSIIESQFSNVEVLSITGTRDEETQPANAPVPIGFIEIAELNNDSVEVAIT